jgi:hypothetical protein
LLGVYVESRWKVLIMGSGANIFVEKRIWEKKPKTKAREKCEEE